MTKLLDPVQETPAAHEHGPGEPSHEHPDETAQYRPQPVGMGIQSGVVVMQDGTDRVMVTFTSVNGSWTVFFDREGAIQHAQQLLGLAYLPAASEAKPEP